MGYAPDVKMFLNSDKMKGLGWEPRRGLEFAYNSLVEYLKQSMK